MKKWFLLFVGCGLLSFVALSTSSCVSASSDDHDGTAGHGLQPLPFNARPRVAVKPFRFHSRVRRYGYGGLSNLSKGLPVRMEQALVRTQRFIVLSRAQMGAILDEQDFGSTDRSDPESAAPQGKIQGAQILVVCEIMDLQHNKSGTGGVFGTRNWGVGLGYKSDYVKINVQAIDIATSAILFSSSAEGTARSIAIGGGVRFKSHGRSYYTAGGGFFKTSIGQAIDECIKILANKLGRAAGASIPGPNQR